MILIANSPFCDKPGAGRVTKTLLYALPLRGQQAVIPAGSADPTYVQARGARPNTIFFPDYVALTIPFSSALVGRRPMTTYVNLVPGVAQGFKTQIAEIGGRRAGDARPRHARRGESAWGNRRSCGAGRPGEDRSVGGV